MNRINPWILSMVVLSGSILFHDDVQAKRRGKAKKDVTLRGIISTLSPEAVVIDGKTVVLKAGTKYEDFIGNRVPLTAFSVGDCVKVKFARGQVVATAREMELERSCPRGSTDDDQQSTPVATVSPSPSVVPSPSATITPSATRTPAASVTPKSTPTCTGTPHRDDDDNDNDDDDDDRGRGSDDDSDRSGKGKRGRDHAEDNS